MVLFHNCGGAPWTSVPSSSLSTACVTSKMGQTFATTYHPFFLDNNCKKCHSPTGTSSIAQFAHPNASVALRAFAVLGPAAVKNKLSGGHNGYTYEQFQTELETYEKNWEDEYIASGCNEDTTMTANLPIEFYEPSVIPNKNKVKDSMKGYQTVVWDLGSRVPGVSVSADIRANVDGFSFPVNFSITNLKVKSPQHKVRIANITVLVNRKSYSNTTFQGIDEIIPRQDAFISIGEGGAVSLITRDDDDVYLNSDGWSLKIQTLQIIP